MPDRMNDPIDILSILEESKSVREGDLTYDVEREALQPYSEIARVVNLGTSFIKLAEKDFHRGVHIWLKADEIAH